MLSLFQVNVNFNGSNWRSKNPYYLRKQKPALIGRITEVLLGEDVRDHWKELFFIYLFIYLFIDINHNCNNTKHCNKYLLTNYKID